MQTLKTPNYDKIKEKTGWCRMRKYDNAFTEEAVKLSDEIGIKKAAEQLGVPYYSLAE